jgi:electron transport complex protein RnfD
MDFPTSPAPHTVAPNSVRRVMCLVIVALLPGIAVYFNFFGWGIAINIAVATLGALSAEAICLYLRKQSLATYLGDLSAVVTAVLLAIALPPLAPWWLTCSGAAFGIVFAKHAFGGLGYNLFNPAMVGFAALLVSFPSQMTAWPRPDGPLTFTDTLAAIFQGHSTVSSVDAITSATPLMTLRNEIKLGATMEEIGASPLFGSMGGAGWEWIATAFIAGGIGLLALRIIRWQIPVSMLGGLFACAVVMHAIDPGTYAGPMFHLFSGATMLCAFFIATDPVSAATSDKGRLIFGAGIGVATYAIRTWGGYPDGVAFAVLLMNGLAPLIDRYTVPRIYGHAA